MTVFHWLGLAFVAYAAWRLPYAPIFDDGVSGLWFVCIMAGSFWLGSTLNSLRSLYAGLAVGASISSALAVAQWFGYSAIPYASLSPAGLYVNSVAQGLILVLIAVALLSERMWLWALPLAPGIALSNSRGAWLALAVGLLSLYVRRAWVVIAIGVASIAVVAMQWSPSDAERMFIWKATYAQLNWAGWGPGSFISWLFPYQNATLYPGHAHNDALQFAFEYGAAAALPFGVFAFLLSRTAAREWPVIAAFAVSSCYSMPLYIGVSSFLVCVVAGRIVGDWGVAWSECHSCGPYVVPRHRRGDGIGGGDAVSVVASH